MALGEIPPWLNVTPEAFVRAASEGAAAGLGARRQYASEVEAGDRLRLAYDTLASQERRADERAQAALEVAQMRTAMQSQAQEAALALREQQAASLDAYRQARLGQYDTEEERRRAAAAELYGYRQARLDQFQQALDISAEKAQAMASRGEGEFFTDPMAPGQVFFRQPSGHVMKVVGQPGTPRMTIDMQTGLPKTMTGPYTAPVIQDLLKQSAPPPPLPSPTALPKLSSTVTPAGALEIPGQGGSLSIGAPATRTAVSPAAGTGDVQAKIDRANQLREDNPDWTKAEIIEQVNNEFQ